MMLPDVEFHHNIDDRTTNVKQVFAKSMLMTDSLSQFAAIKANM